MRAFGSWLCLLGTLALVGLPAVGEAQRVGAEFQVNTYTSSEQETFGDRLIAADASGNFVVVWQSAFQDGSSYGIFGQRYDSAGGPLGSEFRVNSSTTGRQDRPSVASAADGRFVAVWQSYQDGSYSSIFGQRFDGSGVPLGGEFRVNSYTTYKHLGPSVAAAADGDFVVVWSSYGDEGISYDVFGQRFDSDGVAQGAEFRVNSYTSDLQNSGSVA